MDKRRLVVGVTGASGAIYAQRFLREAAKVYDEIYLTLSAQAVQVAATELKLQLDRVNFSTKPWLGEEFPQIRLLNERDYFTPPASGSFVHEGMVIVPCSMGTAGRIANGISNDLVTRAADVVLIAGKGHESTQEIQGTKYPFNDREVAEGILKTILCGRRTDSMVPY